jgi:hypothetical protein
MNKILVLIIALFVFACSPQKKIQKTYIGQPISVLEKELGKALTVFNKNDGKEYIFETVKALKSAEISQHKLTLDPMVSPKATKTERYTVKVVDGVITKIDFDEEYER